MKWFIIVMVLGLANQIVLIQNSVYAIDEIKHYDWLKIVLVVGLANQNALTQNSVPTLL